MPAFKTRARAVDMLGRQQIAGIPTAINELFKNAHDAYADKVEVDYYRANNLFVLRDDGLGMTKDDFENRWLTIGTESKVETRIGMGLERLPKHPNKPPRPILGEKGIGRLAIGVIGPQVLILTKAFREGLFHELVAAFIHWGLFECPGINLEQIQIPVTTFKDGILPNDIDIAKMVDEVRQNVFNLRDYITPNKFNSINEDLDCFKINPDKMSKYLSEPSLIGDKSGTQFYILPVYETLITDIESKNDETAAPLIKMLIGFTNTMTPNHSDPLTKASFRDHKTRDSFDDLISDQEFFTPAEFLLADHHIQGTFDRYGQFNGVVSVYGQTAVEHVVPYPAAQGRETECGPFKFNLAYVQGRSNESSIPQEEHVRLGRKLNKIGGLYIYKDGIRILPYGNNDYDFLDIEKNRTKSASYYYFSYRRMFGIIEISQKDNPNLNEKAGREGFRENRAYRQFKDILSNFFVQIAADFFREGGTYAEGFIKRRAELDRLEKAKRERELQSATKRKIINEKLEQFFKLINESVLQEQISELNSRLKKQLQSLLSMNKDNVLNPYLNIERETRNKLSNIWSAYKIAKPKGLAFTTELRRDWEAYITEYEKLEAEIYLPAKKKIEETLIKFSRQSQLNIDRRRSLERIIEEVSALVYSKKLSDR